MSPSVRTQLGQIADAALLSSGTALLVAPPFSNALIEVASCTLLLAFVTRVALQRFQWTADRPFALLLGVWLIVCFATAWNASDRSLAMRAWTRKTLEYAAVSLAMASVADNERWLRRLLTIAAWSAVFFAIDGIIQWVIGHDVVRWRPIWGSRVTGPMANPNNFGTYLVMVIPVQLWAAMTRPRRWERWLLLAGVACAVWPLTLTDSRMSWLLFGFTIVFFVVLNRWPLLLALPLLLVGGLWSQGAFSAERLLGLSPGRAEAWGVAWRMFLDHPLAGIGHGTYMANYLAYLPANPQGTWPRPQYAHNCYLQLLAEDGIVGLMAFLLVVGWVLAKAFRHLRRSSQGPRSLYSGLVASIGVFLMSITFDTGLYSLPIASLFWSLLGLAAGACARDAATPSAVG